MKVHIEKDLCTSCGICYETFVNVFVEGEEGISEVKDDLKGKDLKDSLLKEAISAAEECPAGAIVVK